MYKFEWLSRRNIAQQQLIKHDKFLLTGNVSNSFTLHFPVESKALLNFATFQ